MFKKNKILIIFLLVLIFFIPKKAFEKHYAAKVDGYILLQVESRGEAWYVYPNTGERYSLGKPEQAFNIMKTLSLGVKHSFIINNEIMPVSMSGRILLDVEDNGKAYYIYPKDLKKYYLGRPSDAFKIMRELGLGIKDKDLTYIPLGSEKSEKNNISGEVLIENVPFIRQAPFGNWSDQRQQDGCEEASSLMAVKWAREENLTNEEGLEKILGASDYILKKYGEYRDISLQDTVDWILKDYFNYENVKIKHNITIQDIISELKNNNILLVPMDGQLLHNPNFTPPGPPRHMVVIRGYDAEKNIIITNDPGTRLGELYEYDIDVFYKSIRDYPTGYHELIEKIEKSMIIISK